MPDRDPRDTKNERPSLAAVLTAAVTAAVGFFVITRSGLAGTLVGAAVFSAFHSGVSPWVTRGLERTVAWARERREAGPDAGGVTPGVEADPGIAPAAATATAEPPASEEASASGSLGASLDQAEADGAASSPRRRDVHRLVAAWGPLVLALAALGASGYSLATGEPIERVIVRERVVEKPVVEERVIVEKETVTVTVTVPGGGSDPSATSTTTTTLAPGVTTTTTPGATTTTVPGATTTTTGGAGGTTTTTGGDQPPTTAGGG